jgi:hypothetical protein
MRLGIGEEGGRVGIYHGGRWNWQVVDKFGIKG